nr:unnamed protein product [Spirometra erinaceieuropaei]
MWYEIVPSFAIMLGAVALLDPICKGISYALYRRWSGPDFFAVRGDFNMFLRDWDVAGSHYKMKGLEAIED